LQDLYYLFVALASPSKGGLELALLLVELLVGEVTGLVLLKLLLGDC
jgi:hypothetical protein